MSKNLTKKEHFKKNIKGFQSSELVFFKIFNSYHKGFRCINSGRCLLSETNYNKSIKFNSIPSHDIIFWGELKKIYYFIEDIKKEFNFDRNLFYHNGKIVDLLTNKIMEIENDSILSKDSSISFNTSFFNDFNISEKRIRLQDLFFIKSDYILIKCKEIIYLKPIEED